MEATAIRGARSHVGEPVTVDVTDHDVVVVGARGRQVHRRARRPAVVTEVTTPRMTLRPGVRLPVDSTRARAYWFDDDHARHRALVVLAHHGWAVRPRRWPLLVAGAVAVAVGVAGVAAGEWLLAVIAAAVVGGCALQSVRNERATRRLGAG